MSEVLFSLLDVVGVVWNKAVRQPVNNTRIKNALRSNPVPINEQLKSDENGYSFASAFGFPAEGAQVTKLANEAFDCEVRLKSGVKYFRKNDTDSLWYVFNKRAFVRVDNYHVSDDLNALLQKEELEFSS